MHCSSLEFNTVSSSGAASLTGSLLSTMTLSDVSSTLGLLALKKKNYFLLQLYSPYLIFNAFRSLCFYTHGIHFKLSAYPLSLKRLPCSLLLFNVVWRFHEYIWYSIMSISEFLLLDDSQPNTDHTLLIRLQLMQWSVWLSSAGYSLKFELMVLPKEFWNFFSVAPQYLTN